MTNRNCSCPEPCCAFPDCGPRVTPPEYLNGFKSGVASVQGEMSLLNALVREATADVVNARRIMRAILYADERGQGFNFHEAMDSAEAFCCDVEARYVAQLKDAKP